MEKIQQEAPWPSQLADLVSKLSYKDGWEFSLEERDRGQGSKGLTFCILITGKDAYHPERVRPVMHYMIVPAASYDQLSWRRWLFDQIGDVETHERCEHFEIAGEKPFAPNHGPGRDPYTVFEYASDQDRRTSFRGEVKECLPS